MEAEGFTDYFYSLSSPQSYPGHIERERHLPHSLRASHMGSTLTGKGATVHQKDLRLP